MHRRVVLISLVLLVGSLQTFPQERNTYDVKVQLDVTSTGTATFSIDRAGNVTGNLNIDTPNVVQAKLSGTVKDGTWTFEYPFTMPDANCSGTAKGTGKVATDRSTVSGTVTVSGACTPEALTGPFMFTRQFDLRNY